MAILATLLVSVPGVRMTLLAVEAMLAVVGLIVVAGLAARTDARLRNIVRRAEAILPASMDAPRAGGPVDRLEEEIAQLERVIAPIEGRLSQLHATTGLPTREPLFARMAQDIAAGGGGMLGIVAFLDFERLAAFDPGLAERLFARLIARASRMLGARPMLAQVDRSRLAVWYGPAEAPAAARAQLDALAYALGGAIRDGDRELLPDIRVGTAACPEAGRSPERLLARAIAALSHPQDGEAEHEGDPSEIARERYALEQDLRRAVDRAEFELHFQPLIDAGAGRVCGAEALLRWRHPVHGLIPPTRFVPIMEAAGLADEIGLWALNAACRAARDWQRLALGDLRVAVNVSGHQLERADMHALIDRTLSRHSLRPEALEIELTETIATGDIARASDLFDGLRAKGIAIAIDDFGTGYSSFSALRRLRFDKIKIDREFVTAVDRRGDSQAICRSILALGHGLGIRVLAEGVERAEEYAWLRAAGCNWFQGYYFSPPLEAHAFPEFVRDAAGLARLLAPPPSVERFVA